MKTKTQLTNRILSLVLTLVMVLGMLPMTSMTAVAINIHSHPVCGKTHTDIGDHTGACEAIKWTEWDGTDITESGNYYLSDNISIDKLTISQNTTVSLCLNGKTLSVKDFPCLEKMDLNICDCTGGGVLDCDDEIFQSSSCRLNLYGGTLTNNNGNGVVQPYWPNTSFYMYGGKITGNTNGPGVGINGGVFRMYGGEISGNANRGAEVHNGTIAIYDGAVISDNSTNVWGGVAVVTNGATLEIHGGRITGNTTKGKECNVYLCSGGIIKISEDLNENTLIGVTAESAPCTFSAGGAAYADKGYFKSDDSAYVVAADGNDLKFVKQFTVSFNANGGTGSMDSVNVTDGAEYTLPANPFTAENGHQFKGWATSANGDVITTETITVTADTTLYAIWENIAAEVPIVEVSENLTLTYGDFTDQKITATVDKKNGYTYSYQWVNDDNRVIGESDTLNIADDTAAGIYNYACIVFATRNDNGEYKAITIRDIWVKVNAKAIDNSADITLSETESSYNGQEQKPTVEVTYNGKILTENTDYTLDWPVDCKNAGNKTVTVNFIGNYSGSVQKTFEITKARLTVTADAKSKTYGESDPALTWRITSGALVNGEQLTGITTSRVSGENANTYAITVSQAEDANKNYNITFVEGTLTVNAKTVAATVIVNDAPFTYNGSQQEPEIVVKDGDTVIPAREYEVSYSNNINAGTATVTVTDKDGGNYVVNGSTTFIINKATPAIGTVGVDGIVKDSTHPSEVNLTRTDTTVDGVLKLADDAMLANKSTYRWVFTPADTDNYNVINGDVQIDVLDTVLPTAVIKVDTNEWKQFINNITFGLFFKETQEVTITAADNENGSGIKDIVYVVSERELDENELATAEWKPYTEAFEIEPDGKFVIYAKITDNDGNTIIINSDGVVVDETAAVVSGITDGETYYGQLMFTVADELAGVKSVVIDGNDETHFEGQYVINADNAEHTVVVTDNAGNVTEYKVTVYKNYTVTYVADGETVAKITVGHGENAAFPKVPAKNGYVGKWDRSNENITSNTVINAVYTEIPVVNPDEVKPEDKTDLEDAKAKLEEELKVDSYTEDDKKDIQDAIDDIDNALEVIGNVEAVEELIDKLPDTTKKDDEAAIKAADDAYNALSDYEKSLVDEDAKKALDDAKAALAELNKPADPNSPATGDNSNMFLWIALLFISGGAVITLTVVDRKRRTASKR